VSTGEQSIPEALTARWRTLCTERGHHALAYLAREYGIALDGHQLQVVWSTAAEQGRRHRVDPFAALLRATGIVASPEEYRYAGVTCGAASEDDPGVLCALAAGHGPVPDPEGEDRTWDHVAPGAGAWWNVPTVISETLTVTVALPAASSDDDLRAAVDHVLAAATRASEAVGAIVTSARSPW
jgi:hypothetical protein